MIEERYCSPEVAKLLREKGFDIPVWTRYEEDNDKVIFGDKYNWNNWDNSPKEQISAPTQSMAIDWLGEAHRIFIEISTSVDLNGNYHFRYTILDKECKYIRRGYTDFDWKYEDACDAAIKYCLENLI